MGKLALYRQIAKQIGGLMVMAVRYDGKEPDKLTGASRVEYALPFEGAWTVLNGGVEEETSHSWDVLTQRYAYDFVILDDEGRSCRPDADPADPASYYCYGLPVLAPADGVVVEAGASCPDAPIALDGAVCCGGDDIRGNFVLVEHAHGEFSCLCHLMPGGVLVEAGQEVRRGQRVGLCGSSGNSLFGILIFLLAFIERCIGCSPLLSKIQPHSTAVNPLQQVPCLHIFQVSSYGFSGSSKKSTQRAGLYTSFLLQ